jgi:hypothetical protein
MIIGIRSNGVTITFVWFGLTSGSFFSVISRVCFRRGILRAVEINPYYLCAVAEFIILFSEAGWLFMSAFLVTIRSDWIDAQYRPPSCVCASNEYHHDAPAW